MKKEIKIILKHPYKSYKIGDEISVKRGHAKNHLIKKDLAIPIYDEEKKKEFLSKIKEYRKETEALFQKIKELKENSSTIKISAEANSKGILFKKIDKKNISEEINKKFNIIVKEDFIYCQKIKEFGEYKIKICDVEFPLSVEAK